LAASRTYFGVIAVLLIAAVLAFSWRPAAAADGDTQSAGGLTVYLGIVPAEIVKGPGPHSGETPMHGAAPHGPHEHHLVMAVFDSASNARIEDATVRAQVSGLGLSGPEKTLEPMKIADSVTYGAYFNLTPDLYTIKVTVRRPGVEPVVLNFKYDHSRP
jgi:hypothetical protein